jgi:hypothetical protein
MKYLSFIGILFLMACGGEKSVPPETYLANAESYAQWVDEKVDGSLAWRSLPEYDRGDNKLAAWVGYREGKPAMVRLYSLPDYATKWWIYADSATGKVLYFKEEEEKDGRKVRNRFAYAGDSLILALASNDPYVSPYGDNDFRLKGAEVEKLFSETIAAVEEDLKVLSPEANAARRENAQFYATGGKNSWSLVINPSISSVTFLQPGAEERKFGYDVPVTGPKNESIYTFNSLNGKIEVSIFGKACGSSDGRNYPYTVVVVDGTKSIAGCGVLLQ